MYLACPACHKRLQIPDDKLPTDHAVRITCPACHERFSYDPRVQRPADGPAVEPRAVSVMRSAAVPPPSAAGLQRPVMTDPKAMPALICLDHPAHREACRRDPRAFWRMVRRERLALATDRLAYFAHWITPEERSLRYDTRFFVASALPGQAPEPDGVEVVSWRWLTPRAALALHRDGQILLPFPTMKILGKNVSIAHEATVGKISQDQIFYLKQRGLSAEQAVSMIVSGFCKEVFKELPMEFALEAQQLLGITLEGSVG